MKRLLKTVLIIAAAVAAVACARHKIIPDKTLALIFHDAFLTNAYINNQDIDLDSLDVYEPIFAKYGYTSEDVQYTIGNFSKRKSARLGNVVEVAIDMLEEEGKFYEKETSVLDTIDNIARRTFTRTVYEDSLIRVGRLRDTARLRIVVDNVMAGDYEISYEYKLDSLDDNNSRKSVFWFERADSSRFGRQQYLLRKRRDMELASRTLHADTTAERLVINLMEFTRPDKGKHTGITVNGLKVVHTPDTQAAVDSLYERQLVIRIFADEFIGKFTPDSHATDSLPSGTASDGDNR